MDTGQNDKMDLLITRSLSGETSAEEEKLLMDWIADREENKHHYAALKKLFSAGEKYFNDQGGPSDIDLNVEWKRFRTLVDQKSVRGPSRQLVPERTNSMSWMRVAAALLLLVATGAVITYFVFASSQRFQTEDKPMAVVLPDGSHILMNRHSRLSYSSHFASGSRTVDLEGEAFFEVTHDPAKPFVIHTGEAEVQVIGTSFNVSAYPLRNDVQVTVETGVVKLSTPYSGKEVRLLPGDQGVFSKGPREITSRKNSDVNFQAWKTRKIIFTDRDLRQVIEILNQVYGSQITINTAVPTSCVLTATFDHQSLEAVLEVLKVTLNLTFRIGGNNIEIIKAGC